MSPELWTSPLLALPLLNILRLCCAVSFDVCLREWEEGRRRKLSRSRWRDVIKPIDDSVCVGAAVMGKKNKREEYLEGL